MSDEQSAGRSALVALLRAAGGTVSDRVSRALAVLVEELRMEVAFVSEFRDGQRVVTHTVSAPGGQVVPVGTAHPIEETLCHLIVSGELEPLVADTAANALAAAHPHTSRFGIGAYAGVPLRAGGEVVGTLCCLSRSPSATVNARDGATLRAVGGYISELLRASSTPTAPSAPVELSQLSTAVAGGHDLEGLTRPLLELLQQITHLDTTFLSIIDWEAEEQRVVYSLNAGAMNIPEGISAPWSDTLCRRAFEEGRPLTTNVPEIWGESEVGRQLGIVTYLTVPLIDPHGAVVGTLCGASNTSREVDPRHVASMEMFGRLVAGQLAREAARTTELARMAALEERMSKLRDLAERDPLTGLLNRAGIQSWLATALVELRPEFEQLAVAFIDLDQFKPINDTHGHTVGDEVLRRLASSLSATGRTGDLYGRLGGDEFIVATMLPPTPAALAAWTGRLRRAAVAEVGAIRVTGSVGVVSISEPELTPTEVLHLADEAMYRAKAVGVAGSPTA
ncbi:diguanylate cyclase [Micromonospora sp. NPDC049679]|uniref:sensor domain-containing diguanylate cyclase n=1 Tax=Micromonospora sp. NPDC049679 TaxID=3155920 RepID=UPI0033EED2CE